MNNESKFVQINENIVKLQIWDTAGQEKYRSMSRKGYQNADAIILIYSVDDKKSFEGINTWVEDIKTNSKENILTILLGNKIDSNVRVVSKEDGLNLGLKYGMKYFECSVKCDINVTESVVYLSQEIFIKGEKKRDSLVLEDREKKKKKGDNSNSGKCC